VVRRELLIIITQSQILHHYCAVTSLLAITSKTRDISPLEPLSSWVFFYEYPRFNMWSFFSGNMLRGTTGGAESGCVAGTLTVVAGGAAGAAFAGRPNRNCARNCCAIAARGVCATSRRECEWRKHRSITLGGGVSSEGLLFKRLWVAMHPKRLLHYLHPSKRPQKQRCPQSTIHCNPLYIRRKMYIERKIAGLPTTQFLAILCHVYKERKPSVFTK
jgi:hypothetical protein